MIQLHSQSSRLRGVFHPLQLEFEKACPHFIIASPVISGVGRPPHFHQQSWMKLLLITFNH
jgi:hypothetical protein